MTKLATLLRRTATERSSYSSKRREADGAATQTQNAAANIAEDVRQKVLENIWAKMQDVKIIHERRETLNKLDFRLKQLKHLHFNFLL